MKTKVEIINETVQYYSEDTSRRGFNSEHGYQYLTPTGKMCAVGRCLLDPNKGYAGTVYGFRLLSNHGHIPIDPELKPEYRGHEIDFWCELQALHDNSEYWNSYGLSQAGTSCVTDLLTKYA
jgi:hypothetical protein